MPKRQKARNLHACHPIMRKGGVHEKSKSAKRAAAKRETRDKASEWLAAHSVAFTHTALCSSFCNKLGLFAF